MRRQIGDVFVFVIVGVCRSLPLPLPLPLELFVYMAPCFSRYLPSFAFFTPPLFPPYFPYLFFIYPMKIIILGTYSHTYLLIKMKFQLTLFLLIYHYSYFWIIEMSQKLLRHWGTPTPTWNNSSIKMDQIINSSCD